MPADDAKRTKARRGQSMSSDHKAVTQVISFLVASFILFAAVGSILVATAGIDGGPGSNVDVSAAIVADILVGSSGTWPLGGHEAPGFLQAGTPGLDRRALSSLRGAGSAADPDNGVVDYEEARSALGIGSHDFHLTIAPVGLSNQLASLDLSDTRTLYIARWNSEPAAVVPSGDDATLVGEARLQVDASMDARAKPEREALHQLGLGFHDAVHLDSTLLNVHVSGEPRRHITDVVSSTSLQGDVLPDRKQYLTATLPVLLAQYDLLVVGSGVQHDAMTAEAVKVAVRDWVLGGGTLIVLGSGSQTTQWLQPLFHVGTTNVNGGAYAPYATHPLLREPHELSWEHYPVPSRAWDIQDRGAQASEDDFDHVIVANGGDFLAISRLGSFADGRIFLTAYQPGALESSLGLDEVMNFLHNVIVHMDRSHLYLEYGAVPVRGVEVGSAVRHSFLVDEQLGPIPVRVLVLVWQGS